MADVDFDEFERGYEPPYDPQAVPAGRGFSVTTLIGAVMSLGLLVGAVVWGYQIAERDLAGVPVIKASGGALRVAPKDPGGEIATHQGLAVNSVAEAGDQKILPDQLVLAPPEQDLLPEDVAGLSELPPPPPADPAADPPVAAPVSPDATAVAVPPDTGIDAAIAAVAEPEAAAPPADLANPSAPIAGIAPATGADADAVSQALAEALADGGSAATEPAASPETPRPKPRPGTDTAAEPADPNAPATVAEVDPATIATGTRLVQLGAFDSADLARGEWERLSKQFGPLWDGKSMVIQSAESGGRTFYRLRALGFADETTSRDFCTALLQQNASCIPVEQR